MPSSEGNASASPDSDFSLLSSVSSEELERAAEDIASENQKLRAQQQEQYAENIRLRQRESELEEELRAVKANADALVADLPAEPYEDYRPDAHPAIDERTARAIAERDEALAATQAAQAASEAARLAAEAEIARLRLIASSDATEARRQLADTVSQRAQ